MPWLAQWRRRGSALRTSISALGGVGGEHYGPAAFTSPGLRYRVCRSGLVVNPDYLMGTSQE